MPNKAPSGSQRGHQEERGLIELTGSFFWEHEDEILSMIKNTDQAKGDPVITKIKTLGKPKSGIVKVTAKSMHFAQSIGKKLAKAYKGEAKFDKQPADKLIRVYWHRDIEDEDQ